MNIESQDFRANYPLSTDSTAWGEFGFLISGLESGTLLSFFPLASLILMLNSSEKSNNFIFW